MTSSSPQKKWAVQRNGLAGSPPRPMNHGCQGVTVDRHGTPRRSHRSETGLVVSGVDDTSMRSTPPSMRSPATVAARCASHWLSLTAMSTPWRNRPRRRPCSKWSRIRPTTKLSASPKPASEPVCGLT
jgi:hypothetical protein